MSNWNPPSAGATPLPPPPPVPKMPPPPLAMGAELFAAPSVVPPPFPAPPRPTSNGPGHQPDPVSFEAPVIFDATPRALSHQAPTDLYAEPVAPRRRKRLAAVAAAAVLLVGGGATAVALQAANEPSGAATPTAAVEMLAKALEDGDILGAVELLPKGERELAVDLVTDWIAEAKRLGASDEETRLEKASAYSLSLTDLELSESEVTDDVVNVEMLSGRYRVQATTPTSPLGDMLGAFDVDPSEETQQARGIDESGDIADLGDDLIITTVRDGEGWHPSIMYSAFDAIRRDNGAPEPTTSDRIDPRGSNSPEDVVIDLIDAIEAGDWERVIELLPPGEWSAAHLYGRTLLGDELPTDVNVSDMTFDVTDAKVGKKVRPTGFRIRSGFDEDVTVTKDGDDCVTIANGTTGESEALCVSDMVEAMATSEASDVEEQAAIDAGIDAVQRIGGSLGSLGMIVVEVEGKWYLSPVRTYSDMMLTMLSGFDKESMENIGKGLGAFVFGRTGGFEDDDEWVIDSELPAGGQPVIEEDDQWITEDELSESGGFIAVESDDDAMFAINSALLNAMASYAEVGSFVRASRDVGERGEVVGVLEYVRSTPGVISMKATPTRFTAASLSPTGTCFMAITTVENGTLFAQFRDTNERQCRADTAVMWYLDWQAEQGDPGPIDIGIDPVDEPIVPVPTEEASTPGLETTTSVAG